MVAWASRFRGGDATLVGTACGAVALASRELALSGPVRVSLTFRSGPELTELVVEGALTLDGATIRQAKLAPGLLVVDGTPSPAALRLDRVLEAVVDLLSDVQVQARVIPDGELVVTFASGVDVSVPGNQLLTVQGAATGPASALRLSAPLVVSVHGATIRLNHNQLRWLGALARVTVHRATLHPDGRVDLEGGGRTGLDRAVRGGLQQASARLSRLVRSSPRFASVRAFLLPG